MGDSNAQITGVSPSTTDSQGAKQIYHAPDGVKTMEMPYISNVDGTGTAIEYFLNGFEVPGFELHEIQASRLVCVDGDWCELGYRAIWRRL